MSKAAADEQNDEEFTAEEVELDDQELEALEADAADDDQDLGDDDEQVQPLSDEENDDADAEGEPSKRVFARKEKDRLKELKKRKKEELERFMKLQNEAIDADEKERAAGRLKYLLQQTEIFAHFAKDNVSVPTKATKSKGRGRHGSKVTEEEEDKEYLREEEDALGEDPHSGTLLTVQPSCIQGKMRDYQLAGLNWLIRLYENGINGILADEMGLGKTLQTISLLGYLHEFKGITGPHLVVAPKSTLGNWIKELHRFCPILRCFKFIGNQEERTFQKENLMVAGKFDVVVTSYEMVIREKGTFRKFNWRYIVIDEAHRIKNENSLLSKTMRLFSSNYRLLITGTPLQNNLHELWALLNFLLPEIFSSAETFDEWFHVTGDKDQQEVVQQLHKVLRPFLLRRLKSDVERGLPPKKETILKVGMSEVQKNFYRSLLQKDIDVINSGGERSRLLNIAMQLRKCCNHPYLFKGIEPGPPYITGDHLVTSAGKMILLDKLLPKLKKRDSRVLIFSQMTRLLDILEDYLIYRRHEYCRIDGNTGGDERESAIESFNKPDSEKFVFLLSTRAGGLGINLATADVVIIYDSDWNPQADLQAMDRAHRIGQKKEVQVFRFCTENTIEEKVIERAYKKLALDALVIQQGRLAEQKAVNKDELLQMVRFGAELVFSSKDSTVSDEDIDRIIAKGEQSTTEMNDKMKKFTEDAIQFKMDDGSLYKLTDPEAEKDNKDYRKMVAENWIEPPRRERKRNYNEANSFRDAMGQSAIPHKVKEPKLPGKPKTMDFQFFSPRLDELFNKEVRCKMAAKQAKKEKETEDGEKAEEDVEPKIDEIWTEDDEQEKQELLDDGFGSWTRKDFLKFIGLCEEFGRNDMASIVAGMDGKLEEEVVRYSKVFWSRHKELKDSDRFVKQIEKGEEKLARRAEIVKSIGKKMDRYKNPWTELKVQYGTNRGKYFDEECDRFLVCQMHALGYGQWEELKQAVRRHPLFRFDWYIKSRNAQELARRCDILVRLVEKENREVEEKERQARKDNRRSSAATNKVAPSGPGRRSSGGSLRSSGPQKRQANIEEYTTPTTSKRRRSSTA